MKDMIGKTVFSELYGWGKVEKKDRKLPNQPRVYWVRFQEGKRCTDETAVIKYAAAADTRADEKLEFEKSLGAGDESKV